MTRRVMLTLGLALTGSLALMAPAAAQAPGYIKAKPEAAEKAFGAATAGRIFSDAYSPVRRSALARSQKTIPGFECPADPALALVQVVPYPIKAGTTAWIERYVVGCQPASVRNLLMILEGDQPRAVEMLPGQTNADPLLQRDALQGAMGYAATQTTAACQQRMVTDTRITTPPSGGAWVERWTLNLCGKTAEMDVSFTPSQRGGTDWSIRPVK